jgi:hypothetical protein
MREPFENMNEFLGHSIDLYMQLHLFPKHATLRRVESQSKDTTLGRVVSMPYQETPPMGTYHPKEIIVYVGVHTLIVLYIIDPT